MYSLSFFNINFMIDLSKPIINNINDIFKYYNDIDLFANYLGIPKDIIIESIKYHKGIQSPIFRDIHPSAAFYQVHYGDFVKTKLKDFRGYFWGDIIDLIIQDKKLDIKKDFPKLLEIIVNLNAEKNDTNDINYINNEFKELLIYPRDWLPIDKFYWNKYDLSLDFLTSEYVYPVNKAFISSNNNFKSIYSFSYTDRCYAYYLYNNNGKLYWQLYFPDRKKKSGKKRFYNNSSILMGIPTISKADNFILAKANKDRLLIKNWAKRFNLSVTSLASASESTLPTNIEITNIRNLEFKRNFVLYDLDTVGIYNMKKIKEEFGFIPLILPRKYTRQHEILKDLSDLYEYYPNIRNELINKFKDGII